MRVKKISSKCWEYKGYTILKDTSLSFPYLIYDNEGFALEAFNYLTDCKKYIDEKEEI